MAKAQQESFEAPGMERKVHKDVEKAAEAYVEVRDTRMKHTERESERKAALIAVMKTHGLATYTDPDEGYEVVLKPGEDNVKVRSLKNGAADDGEE